VPLKERSLHCGVFDGKVLNRRKQRWPKMVLVQRRKVMPIPVIIRLFRGLKARPRKGLQGE